MEWLADEPDHGTVKRAVSDYHALAGYAAEIDPDIAVLEEVAGEEAVQRVFDSSRYHIYVTKETGVQRVALVWKKSIDLQVVDELEELGPGGLRESPDALVTLPAGASGSWACISSRAAFRRTWSRPARRPASRCAGSGDRRGVDGGPSGGGHALRGPR